MLGGGGRFAYIAAVASSAAAAACAPFSWPDSERRSAGFGLHAATLFAAGSALHVAQICSGGAECVIPAAAAAANSKELTALASRVQLTSLHFDSAATDILPAQCGSERRANLQLITRQHYGTSALAGWRRHPSSSCERTTKLHRVCSLEPEKETLAVCGSFVLMSLASAAIMQRRRRRRRVTRPLYVTSLLLLLFHLEAARASQPTKTQLDYSLSSAN